MGRPRELSDQERAELIAQGFKPVEMWVLDWNSPKVREQIARDCELIRESDRRNGELAYLDQETADLWDDFHS
ncbi:MAG: DUF3018 family protein [Rhizobiaceae bacterium]|nr:DUF3018 family protein [Rhizobiaceae bacterium]